MNTINTIRNTSQASAIETDKVLRNTYTLLSMTLVFSALTAGGAMALNLPHPGLLLTLVGYFGLLFLTTKYRDSSMGIACVFALTGFMGYTLGPILNSYMALPNGGQIVMTAMGGTGAIFLALSGYALTTRKDFSFMGGFLIAGILVAFMAGLGAMIFEIPGLSPRRTPVMRTIAKLFGRSPFVPLQTHLERVADCVEKKGTPSLTSSCPAVQAVNITFRSS